MLEASLVESEKQLGSLKQLASKGTGPIHCRFISLLSVGQENQRREKEGPSRTAEPYSIGERKSGKPMRRTPSKKVIMFVRPLKAITVR